MIINGNNYNMKMICINNRVSCYILNLTIGKIYDMIKEDEYEYTVLDDDNKEYGYPKTWFKPLSKIRNERIDKLLSE
jgi:hypothetical protein